MVRELVSRCKASLATITEDYEIVLVNDASPDGSWREILRECGEDPRVKGIDLSRNFGQHYAITAGLRHVSGQWVVVMDCDLQDRPEEIPNLYRKAQEGYDIVFARRAVRKDGFAKRMSSALFYRVFKLLSGMESDRTVANFGIFSQQVIAEFNRMPERMRFFPTLVNYLGFRRTAIDVEHAARAEGKSSYRLGKLVKLAMDVIVANSNRPLQFAVGVGFSMATLSFLLAIYNLFAKWGGIIRVPGFTTTVFSIWFVGGLLLFVLGIMGLYLGKIFDQVKGRPLFIVGRMVNFPGEKDG